MPNTALVRRPGPLLSGGLVTHIERNPPDVARALAQWNTYVHVLQTAGWTTLEVPAADDCPDAVFIEDALVVFRDLAVITRPGAPSRRAETAEAEAAAAALGLRIARIEEPGTLDGGDVLKVATTVYVGRSGRTNSEGIAQLRGLIEPLGYNTVEVPLTKVLHLKSAVTALPDGTIVGWEPAVDDRTVYPRFVAMPEESGAHVVDLGHNTLLMASDCPGSTELVAARGYNIVTVDISEFVKLEGCVTCLSVRVRA